MDLLKKCIRALPVGCLLFMPVANFASDADSATQEEKQQQEEVSESQRADASSEDAASDSDQPTATQTTASTSTFKRLAVKEKLKPNADVDLPQDI